MLAHLTDVSIRSMLLACLAVIALRILRRTRTAAMQHAVWAAVACGMLALFAFGAVLPRIPLRILNGRAAADSVAPAAEAGGLVLPDPDESGSQVLPAIPAKARRSVDWTNLVIYVYAAVALGFLAQFVTGIVLVRRLTAGARAIRPSDGTNRSSAPWYESGRIAIPMTVGWMRPRILLPLEWRGWDREKLDTVLSHEGAHVRRRDGLVAALASLNRCFFWFHPLAWMLDRKLALLAEQACDECCVAAQGDRARYANLLIEMARVTDGSAGRLRVHALTMAAGSHIRQRIESLFQEGRTFSRGMSYAGWAALAAFAIPLVWSAGAVELDRVPTALRLDLPRVKIPAAPVLLAQAQAAPARQVTAPPVREEFEVASVKASVMTLITGGRGGASMGCAESFRMDRGQVDLRCIPLLSLIASAYRIPMGRVKGPDWLSDRGSNRFDIDAKIPPGAIENHVPEMLQTLLADRFKLAVHRATTEQDVLGLVVAKGGLKLKEAAPDSDAPNAPPDPDAPQSTITDLGGLQTRTTRMPDKDGNTRIAVRTNARIGTMREMELPDRTLHWDSPNMTLAGLADILNRVGPLPMPLIDMTGLKGRYQVVYEVSLQDAFAAAEARRQVGGDPPGVQELQSALLKALNDGLRKLGLQLERRKGPVEALLVDHLEKTPTEN